MKINHKNLHELYVKQVKLIANDERFYAIPNATRYAISTYGRLFYLLEGNHHRMIESAHYRGEEVYPILFDDAKEESKILISRLMANVFFPDEQVFRLYNPYSSREKHEYRWKLQNLHIIRTKGELVESFLAQMARKAILTEAELRSHNIEGTWNLPKDTDYFRKLNTIYAGMRTRSTNGKYKQRHPQYAETTISKKWLENPPAFKQYWLDVMYYHPEKLVVDKDIMGFGETNCYQEGLVVPVPVYINDIFTRGSSKLGYSISQKKRKDGTFSYKVPQVAFVFEGEHEKDIICDNYNDALIAGRKRKAAYIRKVVEKERALGYIPEYILEAMERWADMCEAGQIKIWEPSEETIKELTKV